MRDFKQVGTRGFYHPAGAVSLEEGFGMVAAAVAHAHGLGLADIVINTHGLSFSQLTVVDRYTLALRIVESAGGTVRVAFVARAQFIDFQKIGSVMVQNRGIIADVFPTEAEALCWLDSRRMPALDPSHDPNRSAGSD